MKKLVVMSILVISTLIFAKGSGGPVGGMNSEMHGDIIIEQNQIKNRLTEEQQIKFQKVQSEYEGQEQEYRNRIRVINQKMNQEMNSEKLNTKELKRLRKQKTKLLEKMEQNKLMHHIRIREEFGIIRDMK